MISAICLSHSSRFGLLQRSLQNFAGMEGNNELVLVVNEEGYFDAILAYLSLPESKVCLGAARIRPYLFNYREQSEGLLRAMSVALGDTIACWDDDNLSHPQRLLAQAESTWPTCLGASLYYFYDSDELFVTDYAQPFGPVAERCAAASLVFRRELTPYMDLSRRGHWAVAVLERMAPAQGYRLLQARPELFLVGVNGNNMRGNALHRRLGTGLPATWTRQQLESRATEVETWLRSYSFPQSTVTVSGRDAAAFEVSALPVWPDGLASVLPPEDWRLQLMSPEVLEQQNAARREQDAARRAKLLPPKT